MKRKRLPTQQVKRLLGRLLQAGHFHKSDLAFFQERNSIVSELVELLVPFPELICTPYTLIARQRMPWTVLQLLLFAGCDDVSVIQNLVEAAGSANYKVLEIADASGALPLHDACLARLTDDDVIIFLAKQNPNLVGWKTAMGSTVFHCALLGRRSFRVLSTLLDLCPEAAASVPCAKIVLERYHPQELVEKVLAVFPCSEENDNDRFLKLDLTRNQDVPVGDMLQNLLNICSQISRLHLKITDDESGKSLFKHMLTNLDCNKSLKELTLDFKQTFPITIWGSDFYRALHFALKMNTHIEDMKILCLDGNYDIGLFRVMEEGLLYNKTMKCFEYWSPHLAFKQYTGMATLKQRDAYREESLCLQRPDFSSSTFMRFIKGAPNVLNLTSFTLYKPMAGTVPPSKDSLTDVIHTILMSSPRLKSISIFQYEVDMLPIFEDLKINRSLEHFNVYSSESDTVERENAQKVCFRLLSTGNTTLTEVCSLSKCDASIKYLLNLNRMGRSVMRNSGITGKEIVDRLLATRNDKYLSRDKDAIVSIVYGLLRELPGSWCHSEVGHNKTGSPTLPSRKRKARELYHYDYMADPVLATAAPQPHILPNNETSSRRRQLTVNSPN